MTVMAIAAMASNRVIGVGNTLPWDIPEDMKFFREKTKGKIIIVGRKTFESFGGRPLPGRHHLVVTRQADYNPGFPQVEVVPSISVAFARAQALIPPWPDEVCVIGGAEIYAQALPYLDRIYLTVIDREFPGDARFPEFDENTFRLSQSRKVAGDPSLAFHLYERADKPRR